MSCADHSHLPLLMTARAQRSANIMNHFRWQWLISHHAPMQPEQASMCNSNIIIMHCTHKEGRSHSWVCFRGLCFEVSEVLLSCACFSVWGRCATLPWESSAELRLHSQGISAKHQWFIFAALCGVSQPSLTSSAQPGSVKPTEQYRKGPSLQMVVQFLPARGSEGLAAGLEPQPLTG